ncbi:MAG: preprotein translocase subunit SecY [Deltaproteobacteria bacterium]|nr:preprotein translocase subunit SecY [Deltaproteobacteria bacterium]
MVGNLAQAFRIPELNRRIIFTLSMLAVYRLGVFVSTPGVNVEALRNMFDTGEGTLFGMINLFSGGALEYFSIFTLGIAPYISVSIVIQLLTPTIPKLEALRKEGDSGRRVLTRYTRIGTIILALFQSFWIARGLESQGLVVDPGWTFRISTMFTLTAGTAFIMWLGEQITEKGIGNGVSIIIFAGIVARMPEVMVSTIALARTGDISPLAVLLLLVFCIATIMAIVYVERSHRKIPVQYPRRMVGNQLAQAQTQYLPLKVNMSGVIPPIFASAFMVLFASMFSFSTSEFWQDIGSHFHPGNAGYNIMFVVLIVVFCFFYTAVVFNPVDVAENLRKNGGFIPTVRPGKQTSDFLYSVLNRLTLWGSIYISAVCVLPQEFYFSFGVTQFAYVFGGTAVLIVVGVTLDTASQIESLIVARNYEAFMSRSSKSKGGVAAMGKMGPRLIRK